MQNVSSVDRVSVDMEETLANTHGSMLLVQNGRHGTDYTLDDITYWGWVNDAMDFEEFMRIVDMNWVRSPNAIAPCQQHPPLATSLDRLASVVPFDIVTARDGGWYTATDGEPYDDVNVAMRDWLASHNITSYDDFHAVDTSTSKAPLGYDVYIDDKPALAEKLGPNQHQLMIRRPYNVDARDHPRATPVDDVADAVDHIITALR